MTTKLSWRLSKLPTPSELTELVQNKIITPEEAKDILLSDTMEATKGEVAMKDNEALKAEIKFLRELVEKLSAGNRNIIIETIREVRVPYYREHWWGPYSTWCNAISNSTDSAQMMNAVNPQNFSSISTF